VPNGADRSGAYRLIRKLGSLYHSEINLAEWSGVEGFVKQLTVWHVRPELCLDTVAVDVLLAGLKGAASLSASTATQVLDVWWAKDRIAIAAEHLSGLSMSTAATQSVERGEPLPFETVMLALLEVARALEQAHDSETRGGVVVHGDLRPEYVIFGYEGAVKVSGFGFSQFLPRVSPRGEWCTWRGRCYQPPERLRGAAATAETDVFSLGLMLWEAATGKVPYGGGDARELVARLQARQSPFGESPPTLPDDLSQVISRACDLEPTNRYPTMNDLAADLYRLVIEHRRTGSPPPKRLRDLLQSMSDDTSEVRKTPQAATIPSPKSVVLKVPRLTATTQVPRVPRPTTPLLGRVEILRSVSQALAGLNVGRGTSLLVTGEPGMGRTRLLTEIALRLSTAKRTLAWVSVQCRPDEKTLQYSGVLRLFAAVIGLEPWCELSELLPQVNRLRAFGLDGPTLAAIRSVLGEGKPPEPARLAGLLSQGVIQSLSSLSWEQTTILSWDDLHWTDDASLSCLGELLLQLETMPVVVLLTASDEAALDWNPPPDLRTTRLEPLTENECRDLVLHRVEGAEMIDPPLMEALLERSGGNPLLIEELVQLLLEGGRLEINRWVARLVADDEGTLPGIREGVKARLETFEDDTATVAIAAALSGPAMDEKVIARATGLERTRVRGCLDQILARGVIRQRRNGFTFPHDRLRQALLEAAGPERTEALRGPMARAILAEASEGSDGWREHAADLLIEAGEYDEAAKVLVDSAEHRGYRGDLEGAAQRYARALELVRQTGSMSPREELQLCHDAGRAALHSLSLSLGEQALGHGITLAEELNDVGAGARFRVMLCRLLAREGRLVEAMDHAKDAIPLAEAAQEPLVLAQVYGAIAESYQQWGQYGPDMAYLEPAMELARQAGDLSELGRVIQLAVLHAAGEGKFQRTEELLDQVREIADSSGDPMIRCQVLKAENLLHIFSGDPEAALRSTLKGIELAHAQGFLELELIFLHNAGDGHLRCDRMQEALYYFNESQRRSAAASFDRLTEMNEMYIGFLEATYLRSRTGLDRLTAILEKARARGRVWNLTQGHQLLGRALLSRGNTLEAKLHFEEALRLAESSNVCFFIEEARTWLEQMEKKGL
jgi:tetratricopeptide (TPR) repeat protein